ncbi:DNA polymerase Y family protein [Rhizobium sp. CFBP 8762]|uniref:DNA polymerase Y family protein n=1 Tax=Rhizobium sp. CFBP 8762 TaxID=2775279 RepID=UPI001FD48593|nr:DNA polymerase Y family protein [Rhizobium sp. CFBP 8762]
MATDRLARLRWGPSWRSKGRPEHPPVIVSGRFGNAMRIAHLDELAESQGLKLGLGIADARAMCPHLDILIDDPDADRRFLEHIADWCDRYTPLVATEGANGLYLDVTGCAHLFGREESLLTDLLARLSSLGLEARGAVAGSAGLAWALARFDTGHTIHGQDPAEILAPLPLAALRLERPVVEALHRVGLKRVGDILDAPRGPLTRRFGPQPLLRLDQALGEEEEPISPRLTVPMLSAERRLIEPIQSEDDIIGLTAQLSERLRDGLLERAQGGRIFELHLFRVDGKVVRIHARASAPLRDPPRIASLFRERLAGLHDDIDAGFGFETVRLSVLEAQSITATQKDFSGGGEQDRSLTDFADRIIARLGPDSLVTPVLAQSHVPERAASLVPVKDLGHRTREKPEDTPVPQRAPLERPPLERPLRLFAHPEPVEAVAEVPEGPPRTFRWRRALYRVVRVEGPERIAAEWWIDGLAAPTRDYYAIEDEDGRRFWLYREGLYEREREAPRWFLHGLFS